MSGSILTQEQEHERGHPWNAQQSCPLKRNQCTIPRQRTSQPLPQECLLLFSTPTAFPFFQGTMNHLIFPTGRYPTTSYSVFPFQPANNDWSQTKKARKQRAFYLCAFTPGKVPPTGLEPVRPCGQQILSLQRLPFRHEGIDRTALYRNAAGIQARIPSGF